MPELPEVETIRRDLLFLSGHLLKEIKIQLPKMVRPSPEVFRKALEGRRLKGISRKGKLLIFDFGKESLLVHLGLTGALVYQKDGHRPPHTHVILSFDEGYLLYTDLRQFGWLEVVESRRLPEHRFYASLGPDALEIGYAEFESRLLRSRRGIKALLLDQKVIAGLGNIYTDEALFRAGIHPERKAASLTRAEVQALYQAIQEVLNLALELRGSSVRNYVDGTGTPGRFQEEHLVYGKRGRPCPRCGTPLAYRVVATRGTTFCPRCQK